MQLHYIHGLDLALVFPLSTRVHSHRWGPTMIRLTGKSKLVKAQNYLADAQLASTGANPSDLLKLAALAMELSREFTSDSEHAKRRVVRTSP